MRIVHCGLPYLPIPAPKGGANEKIIYELAKVQAEKHEVHVLSVGLEAIVKKTNNIHLHYLPCQSGPGAEYRFYAQMAKIGQCLSADVFHLHASSLAALFLKLSAGRSIPVVASINYPYIRPNLGVGRIGILVDEMVARLSLNKVDEFGFISEYSYSLFRERYGNVRGRTTVIPVGVDLERYMPNSSLRGEARSRYGLDGRKVVLFVGRICEQKGVHVLVDALAKLTFHDPGFVLVLAGPAASTFHNSADAAYAQSIIQRLRSIGGKYLGEPTEDELVAIMNAADVLVLPTLRMEMFGMVLIEALACGKAVVGSSDGGIPEVIGDSPAGRLFPPGDASALESVLREMFTVGLPHPSVARARAQMFDWGRIAQMYYAEYERAKEMVPSHRSRHENRACGRYF